MPTLPLLLRQARLRDRTEKRLIEKFRIPAAGSSSGSAPPFFFGVARPAPRLYPAREHSTLAPFLDTMTHSRFRGLRPAICRVPDLAGILENPPFGVKHP